MGYAYKSWHSLCTAVSGWENPGLKALIHAEHKTSQDSTGSITYRTVSLMPDLLQIKDYIDAVSRGNYASDTVRHRRLTECLSRQSLLSVAGVRQLFLVDEAALTFWPGRFMQYVTPQLIDTKSRLLEDMEDKNLIDFRIIPNGSERPFEACEDFALLETETEAKGFTMTWPEQEIYPVEDAKIDRLRTSCEFLGKMALSREESFELLNHKISELL